jgi:hypothetical protein
MPIGRYFSHPISIECTSIEEVREFLCGCEYVSDEELFGKKEHWQPPEEFEQRRKGDCDDFALWTWRQLLNLGYDARLAVGVHGRYLTGHAWVLLYGTGRTMLLEPLRARLGMHMPQLSTISYHPIFSIAWVEDKPVFYQHDLSDLRGKEAQKPKTSAIIRAIPDWLATYSLYWITHPLRLARYFFRRMRSVLGLSRNHLR